MRRLRRTGGLQRKFFVALLIVGIVPGMVALWATYRSSTATLKQAIGGERGWTRYKTKEQAEMERQHLFDIMRDLVLWENTNNEKVLQAAREEIWKSQTIHTEIIFYTTK